MRSPSAAVALALAACAAPPPTPAPAATATATATAMAPPPTHHGLRCTSDADCAPDSRCTTTGFVAPWDHLCRMKCTATTACPATGGLPRCENGLCPVAPPGG